MHKSSSCRKELLCTLSTLLDLGRFDCANKTAKKLSLKQVELVLLSLSVSLLVKVSKAVFLKMGNIAPLGGEREAPESEKQKEAKAAKGGDSS